eukprot:10489887-Heterocapsa_arctica.AAC.1
MFKGTPCSTCLKQQGSGSILLGSFRGRSDRSGSSCVDSVSVWVRFVPVWFGSTSLVDPSRGAQV